MTIQTIDKLSKLTSTKDNQIMINQENKDHKQLYFVNLDNYFNQQFNNKLNLNNFKNSKQQINNYNQLIDNQQPKQTDKIFKDINLNNNLLDRTESTVSNCCFIDRITDYIERRLLREPIFNLIKFLIILLTIVQFCIFILAVITYKNNEQLAFHSKYGDYFILGTNLANLNALLSTCFYLYSIICEIWILLGLMTFLQTFYSIIELLALLIEPIKVQYIYIIFIMLTSVQTLSMLLFVVMLRIKKLKERNFINHI